MENKYFVYNNGVLIAAQDKFRIAMRYFKKGCNIFKGTPAQHKKDLTQIANKLKMFECK